MISRSSGRITLCRFRQSDRINGLRVVTPSGIRMEVSPVSENANSLMDVTLSGISREVRFWQNQKAPSPMVSSPAGSVISVSPVQSLKELFPIVLTPDGITMVFRFAQQLKAPNPIVVTLSGITACVQFRPMTPRVFRLL